MVTAGPAARRRSASALGGPGFPRRPPAGTHSDIAVGPYLPQRAGYAAGRDAGPI